MYIIVNKTTNTNTNVVGNFPSDLTTEMLNRKEDIIIISLYSNTIKIPYLVTEWNTYGENVYEWKDFKLPKELSNR